MIFNTLQNKIDTSNKKGFLLVEMLMYIAILTLVSTASISILFNLRSLVDIYRADQYVTQSAQVAMERMLYEIRAADGIDAADPSSVLVSSPGHLVITRGATTTEFYLSGNVVMLMVNGVAIGPLTRSDVSVGELRFFPYDNTLTEAVRVQMTLTGVVGDATSTAAFTSSAVLRGTYD